MPSMRVISRQKPYAIALPEAGGEEQTRGVRKTMRLARMRMKEMSQ